MADYLFLTKDQIRQLDDIYTSIVRKYRNQSTESAMLDSIPRITKEDAEALAEAELGARRDKILETYTHRVENINENAYNRGLLNSTIVLEQLDRAYAKKAADLERLDNMTERLVKKIMADNAKLSFSIEREKSISRSRALRDFVAVNKMKISVPYNAQALIEQDVYDAYLAWLLQYTPQDAYDYVNHNTIFLLNMGSTKRSELISTLNTRRLTS